MRRCIELARPANTRTTKLRLTAGRSAFSALALLLLFAGADKARAQVQTATYLGGPGVDRTAGVAFTADGTLLVAANFAEPGPEWLKAVPKSGSSTGDGWVVRLSAKADRVLSAFHCGGTVTDLDVTPAGTVVVAGSFGAALLDRAAAKALWMQPGGGKTARIAPGPDGGAVVLVEKKIHLVNTAGQETKTWAVAGGYATDVTFDAANRLVIVCGFDNKRGVPPGQKNYPVQVAFIYAYHPDGRKAWTAYGWKGQEVADLQLMADTRAYRVVMGADGKLYVAGESAGGNTMWLRQSQDLQASLPKAKRDGFQTAFNTRANHITFVGRLDPKTGKTENGTLLLARAANGRGNTIRPRALAADAQGRVYVGGASASSPPVSQGAFGGNYEGGGSFFCIFSPNFQRLYTTKLGEGGGTDDAVTGIAVTKDRVAVVGAAKTHFTPVQPLQAKPGGSLDGWLVIFRRRGAPAEQSPVPPQR